MLLESDTTRDLSVLVPCGSFSSVADSSIATYDGYLCCRWYNMDFVGHMMYISSSLCWYIIPTFTSTGFLNVVVDTFTLRLLAAPDSIRRTRHLQTGAQWYCILHTLSCDPLGNRPLPLGSSCGGVAYEAHCLLFTHRAPFIGENAVAVGSHFSKKGDRL